MSDRVRALVWIYYDEKRFGAPMITAIALSDEADDRGGGISESNSSLAKKTRQDKRNIRRQLRLMEASGLLVCIKRSAGGPGQFSEYRIDLGLLVSNNEGDTPPLTRAIRPSCDPLNEGAAPPLGLPTKEGFKELPEASAPIAPLAIDAEDRRLAEWMLGRLRAISPGFREPSWPAWCKDIRLMRERDGRTHHAIAALFAFANGDAFWQANILSPGKLRKQWDQLDMKRGRNGGASGSPAVDKRCSWDRGGARCAADRVFTKPNGEGYCRNHLEEVERGESVAAA